MTKAKFGWAHIRTHMKHACFFSKGQVILHNGRPCRVVSAKTSVPDSDGLVCRNISILDVLTGKNYTIVAPANGMLEECRVVKEEFEVRDKQGNLSLICAMPVVELRERPLSQVTPRAARHNRRAGGFASKGASSVETKGNEENAARRHTGSGGGGVAAAPAPERKKKQRVVYKTSLWRPFETLCMCE